MDLLPPELLSYIVVLACTDGGRTASSLRLVSKYVSDVTEPYRFHSVAISGRSQIERFWKSLRDARPDVQAKMHHLFVSDAKKDLAYNNRLGVYRGIAINLVEKVQDHEALQVVQLVEDILLLVSPTLQTLTCIVYNPRQYMIFRVILTTPLSNLTHLTLRLSSNPDNFFRPHAMSLPSLTHLHIAYALPPNQHYKPLDILLALTSWNSTDTVTHIRLSGVRFSLSCPPALCRLLGTRSSSPADPDPASSDDARLATTQLSMNVRRFVVQPEVAMSHQASDIEVRLRTYTLRRVKNIYEESVGLGEERFVLLPPAPVRPYEEWKKAWSAVLAGLRCEDTEERMMDCDIHESLPDLGRLSLLS